MLSLVPPCRNFLLLIACNTAQVLGAASNFGCAADIAAMRTPIRSRGAKLRCILISITNLLRRSRTLLQF
jgi:hypothetical protein